MRIALLQLKPFIGDLEGNAAQILEGVKKAAGSGAQLAITSELALLGYPPRDLLLSPAWIDSAWAVLKKLAQELKGLPPTLVGTAEASHQAEGRPLYNSAVLLAHGEIRERFRKTLLPTYDVFDEDRYFEPASELSVLRLEGKNFGVTICEDIWNDRDFMERRRYRLDPVEQLANLSVEGILNLSASPFTVGKQRLREKMLSRIAKKHSTPIFYVNQVGGNDDLVFDGRSLAFDAGGNLLARGKPFETDIVVVDLESKKGPIAEDDFSEESEIWNALTVGTEDYAKRCGFKKALLGLSGGIDSAVTAAVAVQALGKENVIGVLMPSPHSSAGSMDDSLELAKKLGMGTFQIPIQSLMESFEGVLKPLFGSASADVTEENLQSRIRGTLLMALSNKWKALLLTTGNKSEMAVGYCTLYGDMNGGFAVLSDVPKTMVYRLARWLNRKHSVIPEATLTKAPSAELRPNQTDQDSLPPYDVLDAILHHYIEKRESPSEITARGFDPVTVEKVVGLVQQAEFKRRQAAPGIKVTDRAFGVGWRMPLAKKIDSKR